MSEKEEIPTAEQSLAPELASEQKFADKGEIDIRLLSYLNPIEVIVISHFKNVPKSRGGGYAGRFFDDYLHLKCSESGRRANQLIEMVHGSPGVKGDLRSFTERHLTLRDEEKARQKGKIVE